MDDGTYTHARCGKDYTLPEPVFQLYQREPWLFLMLDCPHCNDKFPVEDFVWKITGRKVKVEPPA